MPSRQLGRHLRYGVRKSRRIHLIASLGGHLELLHAVSPVLSGLERVWITSEGSRAGRLREDGEVVRVLPRLDRGSLKFAAILAGAVLALRERPSVVVSTGAGLTLPFVVVSRILGARIVFIETMARVKSGSLSGRVSARLGATMIVQWPQLLKVYPGSTVCRPTLLDVDSDVLERVGEEGGTFVTVGSHDTPFTRLLQSVDAAVMRGLLPAPVMVQRGVASKDLVSLSSEDFLSPSEFARQIESCSVVVTHGGAGALSSAIRAGKRPLVMVRCVEFGEHVDDHQSELVDELDRLGLVARLDGGIEPDDVAATRGGVPRFPEAWSRLPRVADVLAHYLEYVP